jgi:hypothetical protein
MFLNWAEVWPPVANSLRAELTAVVYDVKPVEGRLVFRKTRRNG